MCVYFLVTGLIRACNALACVTAATTTTIYIHNCGLTATNLCALYKWLTARRWRQFVATDAERGADWQEKLCKIKNMVTHTHTHTYLHMYVTKWQTVKR